MKTNLLLICLFWFSFANGQVDVGKVLLKQLKQGTTYGIDEAGGGLVKEPFQIEELNASSQIVDSILKSNNFKKGNYTLLYTTR